jgi:hypothetical protein
MVPVLQYFKLELEILPTGCCISQSFGVELSGRIELRLRRF